MANPNSSSSKIAVALLGTGYIADYHYKALRKVPNVDVRAVCDLRRTVAQQFADRHGIGAVYTDLGEMLRQESLDVVHVLTPPPIHYQNGVEILGAGVDIFMEKPLCHRVADCQDLRQRAQAQQRTIGVSHNFLYFPVYEKLVADLKAGRLGKVDQIDIVWNKELGFLKGGPFSLWTLQEPTNILFEVCPHSFVHLLHLIGQPDELTVHGYDRVALPRGLSFYRCWEMVGHQGPTTLRLRFGFGEGYPEHYISIRGSRASARVDFEKNLYTRQEHTPYMQDVDRFLTGMAGAWSTMEQLTGNLKDFVLFKMKLSEVGSPYLDSITYAIKSFYATRQGTLDDRLAPELGEAGVAIGESLAQQMGLPAVDLPSPVTEPEPAVPTPTVLVIGGTGFIGKALVKRLRAEGYGVRLVARDPKSCPQELRALGIEVVKGDFGDPSSIAASLTGIEYVYHLGRGTGETWADFLQSDVQPTEALAQVCLNQGIKRFFYTSSIAIYYAGQFAKPITEITPPHPGVLRAAPYARAKAENERLLLDLHRTQGLPVVIFRPGIVLGPGGDPRHWGIAAWPYPSVCCLWGKGDHLLPIVLVDDVAEAMVKAIAVPDLEGESFNLTSEPCLTANDYLDELEKCAGIQLKRVPTPAIANYAEAVIKWGIKAVGKDPQNVLPSYADWDGRSFAAPFDASKAQTQLGWKPIKDRDTLIRVGIQEPVKQFF